jgi:hypothetical protein
MRFKVYEESNLFPYSPVLAFYGSFGLHNCLEYISVQLVGINSSQKLLSFISGIVDILSSLKIASYDERENGNRCNVIMHK